MCSNRRSRHLCWGSLGTNETKPLPLPFTTLQGGKKFCASFCASLIAGSRRAFLCVYGVDRVRLCLFVDWDWMKCTRCERLLLEKPFYHVCGFCSSSLENYFGLGTTDVKAKTDHSVSLRWNKKFWAFSKRRVFFWLCIGFYIRELISPSFAGLN